MNSCAPASFGRPDDGIHRQAGIGERNVVPHGAMKEKILLEYDPDLAAEPRWIDLREIDAVDQIRPCSGT